MARNIFTFGKGTEDVDQFDTQMSPAEEIQAQADESDFQEDGQAIQEDIASVEDAVEAVQEMEGEVAQHEVNVNAVEGGDAIEGGVEITTDGGETATVVTAEEVPAPQVDASSAPEEVAAQTQEVQAAIEHYAGRLGQCRAADFYSQLGISYTAGGIESSLRNPVQSYKDACEAFKDTLVKVKNKVIDILQKIGQFIVRWFRKFMNAVKMTGKRAKTLKTKLQDMKPADYKVRENDKLPAVVGFAMANGGKKYVSERAAAVDEAMKKVIATGKKILTGKLEPEECDKEAIKEYNGMESIGLFKKILEFLKINEPSKYSVVIPVDNTKAIVYEKITNADAQDKFPRFKSVDLEGEIKKSDGLDAKKRIDIALELANSVIQESGSIGKKMDDASKAISDFKKAIENLTKAGGSEGEGRHKANYAFRRSITISSDLFKIAGIYGLIPSQALTAANALVASLEKKESAK